MFNINFADDWIRTVDLWCRKRPLYQLSHNHCPSGEWIITLRKKRKDSIIFTLCTSPLQNLLTLYQCMTDLLFYLFEFSCFVYIEFETDLLVWSNPNQSNRRPAVQWYFSYKESKNFLLQLTASRLNEPLKIPHTSNFPTMTLKPI